MIINKIDLKRLINKNLDTSKDEYILYHLNETYVKQLFYDCRFDILHKTYSEAIRNCVYKRTEYDTKVNSVMQVLCIVQDMYKEKRLIDLNVNVLIKKTKHILSGNIKHNKVKLKENAKTIKSQKEYSKSLHVLINRSEKDILSLMKDSEDNTFGKDCAFLRYKEIHDFLKKERSMFVISR